MWVEFLHAGESESILVKGRVLAPRRMGQSGFVAVMDGLLAIPA
jgi:hypothetical protein